MEVGMTAIRGRTKMIAENWVDLLTIQDVAKAQAAGWEISVKPPGDEWVEWKGSVWWMECFYRGRPRQPKMKQVSVVGWYDGEQVFRLREGVEPKWPSVRVYSEDGVIEVPDTE
jgi:hypothetical protein